MKFPTLLATAASLLLAISPVAAQVSALGAWSFDDSRKDLYVESVRASQVDTTTMSEIAVQMGMAQIQNSVYEFGYDQKTGPYLEISDKASKQSETHRLKIKSSKGILIMERLDNGEFYRMEPIDNERMTLVDVSKKLIIPLRRL